MNLRIQFPEQICEPFLIFLFENVIFREEDQYPPCLLYTSIVFHKLHGLVDHQIFQPLFTDSLFLAALVLFSSSTFIIAVDFTRPTRAAFAKHQRSTVAAEQLGGEQVVILCLSTGRGFLIFGDLLLHILKQFQRNDGRDSIRYDHIPEFQFSDVTSVFEHMFDTVISECTAHRVLDTIFIQPIPNFFHRKAVPILLERFQYERRGKRVNVEFPLGIQRIAKGSTTTIAATFQDVLRLSTDNLFGKVGRVVFCIACLLYTSPFVVEAFRRYNDGATMKELMNWLNDSGVTTNRNQKFTYNSVQTLLTNKRYIRCV